MATDAVLGGSVGTWPPSTSGLTVEGESPPQPKALAENRSVSCQKERDDKCSAYLLGKICFANEV